MTGAGVSELLVAELTTCELCELLLTEEALLVPEELSVVVTCLVAAITSFELALGRGTSGCEALF